MSARVITVRLDPDTGLFDDADLVSFLDKRRLLSMSEHAFVYQGVPTLALVVQVEAPLPAGGPRPAPRSRPQDALAAPHRALFEALRSWRNARAKKEGRPAYVLFTNAQLSAIAVGRPVTRRELQAIEGIGQARIDSYADQVLQLVAAMPAGTEEVPDVDRDTAPRP